MTGIILEFIPHITAALVALGGALGLYLKGRRDARDKAEAQRNVTYIETRKRADAENHTISDVDAIRERLRKRGE